MEQKKTTTAAAAAVGSAVVLDAVDDFVSPAAACVNPLFLGGSAETETASTAETETETAATTAAAPPAAAAVVVPRQRRRQRRRRAAPVDGGGGAATTAASARNASAPPHGDSAAAATAAATAAAAKTTTRSTTATTTGRDDDTTTADRAAVVSASLADCLACSGCITTAETVLLEEQHSLDALRGAIAVVQQNLSAAATSINNNEQQQQPQPIAVTVSPASWADLLRHWEIDDGGGLQLRQQQQLAALLHRHLGAAAVLDGNVPLQISRHAAADEFLRAYRRRHHSRRRTNEQQQQHEQETAETNNGPVNSGNANNNNNNNSAAAFDFDDWEGAVPSAAVSATEAQLFYGAGGAKAVAVPIDKPRTRQALPLVAASCPAVVCLVEKQASQSQQPSNGDSNSNSSSAVSHLSTVPSPMTVAAQLWRRHFGDDDNHNQKKKNFLHVAVMPCHDKKLEASRRDFVRSDEGGKDVDLVLTTRELVQLLHEYIAADADAESDNKNNNGATTAALRDALLAQSTEHVVTREIAGASGDCHFTSNSRNNTNDSPVLLVLPQAQLQYRGKQQQNHDNDNFFTLGSGGYADYIFRRAAVELFGVEDDPAVVEPVWRPVSETASSSSKGNNNSSSVVRRVSARTAQRRRDYYEAVLLRRDRNTGNGKGGARYYVRRDNDGDDDDRDAAVALRFAVAHGMQTVQTALQQENRARFDYIEAMACPSGACLNGGGQLRVSERESPSETRQRVAATRDRFVAAAPTAATAAAAISLQHYTRYHVVPVMQHSLGAAAGVAVQDTQW